MFELVLEIIVEIIVEFICENMFEILFEAFLRFETSVDIFCCNHVRDPF